MFRYTFSWQLNTSNWCDWCLIGIYNLKCPKKNTELAVAPFQDCSSFCLPISVKGSIIHFVAQVQTPKRYSWFFSFPHQLPHPILPSSINPLQDSPLVWPLLTSFTTPTLVTDTPLSLSLWDYCEKHQHWLACFHSWPHTAYTPHSSQRDPFKNINPLLKSFLWILFTCRIKSKAFKWLETVPLHLWQAYKSSGDLLKYKFCCHKSRVGPEILH